jgi:hypothetical protein
MKFLNFNILIIIVFFICKTNCENYNTTLEEQKISKTLSENIGQRKRDIIDEEN